MNSVPAVEALQVAGEIQIDLLGVLCRRGEGFGVVRVGRDSVGADQLPARVHFNRRLQFSGVLENLGQLLGQLQALQSRLGSGPGTKKCLLNCNPGEVEGDVVGAVGAHDAPAEAAVVLPASNVERPCAGGAELDGVLRQPRHHRLLVGAPLQRVRRHAPQEPLQADQELWWVTYIRKAAHFNT